MVNLEPGRDYYADLELTPQASINDVRKQFRKLALKYHPDRNPGQETAFNSKFQAISAANEILTDPQLRAKFDAQRLKEGPSRAFGDRPVRPNVPPRARPTEFPPPPRPPPPSAHKSTFSPPPSAGVPRKHERAPRPNSAWASVDPDEAKAKTNDFKAWEQMRHGQGPIPKQRPPPSRTPTSAAFENDRTSPPRKAPDGLPSKARRRWEDLLDAGMSNLGKYSGRPPPKKPGHAHEEDDLQAKQTAYSLFAGDHAKKPMDIPPPPPRATRKPEPAGNHPKESYAHNNPRVRAPYPTVSVEQMQNASPGLHRATTSATTRETKPRPAWANADSLHIDGSHIRANSAGASHREGAFRSAGVSSTTSEATSSASSDEAEPEYPFNPTGRKTRIPKSRKPRIPAGVGVRRKSGFSPHYREDEGQAPHPGYADLRRHSGIDLSTQNSARQQSEGLNAHRANHGASQTGAHRQSLSAHQVAGDRFPQRHRSFDGRYQSPSGLNGSGFSTRNEDRNPMYGPSGYSPLSSLHYSGPLPSERWSKLWPFGPHKQEQSCKVETPPFWAIPSSLPPTSRQNRPNSAHANANIFPKSKVPAWPSANLFFGSLQTMMDNSKSYTPPPPFRSQSSETISTKFSHAASPPRFGGDPFAPRRSPRHDSDNTAVPSESKKTQNSSMNLETDPLAATDIPPPPKVGDKWSSEEWEKRFGTHTFEIPASNVSSRATSRKRSGTPKTGSMNNLKRAGTFRSNGFQPSVIDDSDDLLTTNDEQTGDPNNVTFKSRTSDASDGNAMDIDSTPPAAGSHEAEGDISPTTKIKNPSSASHGSSKSSKPNGTLESEPDSRKMNLAGFRHVAPFSSANEGFGGIEDLKNALPFESRPSPTKPDFAKCYEELDLPNPPRAPSPPEEIHDLSFSRYISAMNHYMFNWNSFSTKVLMHFQRRQEEHREIGQGWIGQVGGDVDAYMHALDEDEKGREWWSTACGKHKATMQNLKGIREKMLKTKGTA